MNEIDGLSDQKRVFDRDWTQGSIVHNLMRLSWPMIVSMSIITLGPVIEMVWMGRLGATSVAAAGVAGIVVQLLMGLMGGLTTGLRAVIARHVGASDFQNANNVAQQAFVISAVFAVLAALASVFLPRPILSMTGMEADVVAKATAYIQIVFAGMIFTAFGMISGSIMQSSGDTITPMKLSILSRLFHLVLSPFLVFGWWIFPRLEVNGAALTNVITGALSVTAGLWLLFSGRSRLRPTLRGFRLDPPTIWRIVRIGLPASVSQVQWGVTEFLLMTFIAPFGTIPVAAHAINQRVLMVLILPGVALGQAAGVLVGQNLGAGQADRAEKVGWLAAGIMEVFAVICSVAILIWADEIMHLFTNEPELIEMGSDFLRIASVGFFIIGFTLILQLSLEGAGDTTAMMVLGLVMVWVLQMPLAYFLSQIEEFGVYGVRWGLVASGLLGGFALPVYFRMGRWKRKAV
ncbi:MAG: MATE family efflux transporter [Desulfobacterales bacterium]